MQTAEPDMIPDMADTEAVVRRAASPSTAAAALGQLASDPRVIVRATVAMNAAAPVVVDSLLAQDQDERVRGLLARKLAQLAPSLSDSQRQSWQEETLSTLRLLAQDTALRVRLAITDVVSAMEDAPRDMILRLARDHALPVSEPVIRLSPLLSTADLIGLLQAPPHPATARAVAMRAGLDPTVSDEIAQGSDHAAITALLCNQSVAIREATLDALTARTAHDPDQHLQWHEPLARRPELSAQAAQALAEFVTADLLEMLTHRAGLSTAQAAELRRRLRERRHLEAQVTGAPAPSHPARHLDETEAREQAAALRDGGRLTEAALLDAAARGDERACIAMLATAAGIAPAMVEQAARLRSAKSIVSLVWAAGFSMRAAGPMQTLLAKLPPVAVQEPAPDGGFPFARETMQWQLNLMKQNGPVAVGPSWQARTPSGRSASVPAMVASGHAPIR